MKPIKFDLPLNGARVGTLEQLKNNLSAEVLEHFRSGKLAKWLRARNLTEQVDAVDALLAADTEHEEQLLKSLYELFGGEISDDLLRAELAKHKKSLPVSQETIDTEIETIQAEFNKEIKELRAEFAKREVEFQQEIEQLKNPPTPKLIGTRMGQFIVRDDGTAFDTTTGLTWCRFAHGQTWQNGTVSGNAITLDWDSASEVAQHFNQQGGYAGCTDWRLPKVEELSTLADKIDDITHMAVFMKIYNYFWSSSVYDSYYAYCVSFSHGKSDWLGKGNKYPVRLVRN